MTAARNKFGRAVVASRRRQVAALRLRGLTQREIQQTLPLGEDALLNPATGKPWSLGIINRDLQFLESEWQADARRDTAEHKARQLAEHREARRLAWSQEDLPVVLKSLAEEAKLLGLLDAAARINGVSVEVNNTLVVEREQRFERLFNALNTPNGAGADAPGSGGDRGEPVHPNGSGA